MATYHESERPCCQTNGCKNPAAIVKYLYDDYGEFTGYVQYRKWCQSCHRQRTASKHGLTTIDEIVAKNAGFDSVLAYRHSLHPYLKHRKQQCENVDGRLGFVCTTTIHWLGMLDVDHIDGDPSNNAEENLQTLCKCCHSYKSHVYKDHLTPGRKALGVR